MSKPSYTTYIRHRVAGIEPDPRAAEKGRDIMIGRDLLAHPDFADRRRNFSDTPFPGCVGPLRYKDRSALDRDLAHLKAAASQVETRRRVHDRALARHPDPVHHQPALSERGRIRGGARRRRSRPSIGRSSKPASCCRSTRRISARHATTSTATSATTSSARSPSATSKRSTRRPRACRRIACGCTSAGATTRGRTPTICR